MYSFLEDKITNVDENYYYTETNAYIRVSRVLDYMLDKPGLAYWLNKKGVEGKIITEVSNKLGTMFHDKVHHFLQTGESDYQLIRNMYHDVYSLPHASEITLLSKYGFGGTIDALYFDGLHHLVDTKSHNMTLHSTNLFPSPSVKTSHPLQIAAYSLLLQEKDIEVYNADIRYRLGTGGWATIEIPSKSLRVYENRWLSMFNQFVELSNAEGW